MKNLLALLLLTSSLLFAQGRFDGTWEMKMDTLEFAGTPEKYLLNEGMFHCMTCSPKIDVRTDHRPVVLALGFLWAGEILIEA